MKGRDLLILVAVTLVAGFAVADAIRGSGTNERRAETTTERVETGPTRRQGPQPQPDAPAGWRAGALASSLIFTDADTCRIRAIGLAGGRERPLTNFTSDCQLWAAPVGERLAYGLGPSTLDGFTPFRLADLGQPARELGGFRALFGVVIWSHDGQRVAWCGSRRTGFDLAILGSSRRLPNCPVAYTPTGELAYALGNRLVVGGRTVVRTDGDITYAKFGTEGSLAVVVEGSRVERYAGGRRTFALDLPPELQGRTPVLPHNTCAAAFVDSDAERVDLLGLGCFRGADPQQFEGHAAAWSPEGTWLATAEAEEIVFHQVVGPEEPLRWPARAAQIAWRLR